MLGSGFAALAAVPVEAASEPWANTGIDNWLETSEKAAIVIAIAAASRRITSMSAI